MFGNDEKAHIIDYRNIIEQLFSYTELMIANKITDRLNCLPGKVLHP